MAPRMSLLLAAFAIAAQAGAVQTEPYRAQGSDPDWTLNIAREQMTFRMAGRPSVSVATPEARTESGIREYRTSAFTVSIMESACTDRASGRRYADAVFVSIGNAEHGGCGGTLLPLDSLDGTSWHFTEIDGEAVPLTGDLFADDRYAIDFSAEAFAGYGGCNRITARYARTGDTLTALPPFGATSNSCAADVMRRERRLLEILSEPVRLSFPDPSTMQLTGARGMVKLRRVDLDEMTR